MGTVNERLAALSKAGVSIWLDDLSRERIRSGNLLTLINDDSVRGVTTNPTIFAAAFKDLSLYGDQLSQLKGTPVDEVIRSLMTTDVKAACQLFDPVYQASEGYDGRVSIEVEPGLAHDTEATVAQAALLAQMVGEPNVLIKIPATVEGLPAIRRTIAAGISVNVTLIFSLERYRDVMAAYLDGLDDAAAAGHDISKIHSVASFFVSRVDTEVDRRLEEIGSPEALALRGQAAVANARAAYAEYIAVFGSERFAALADKGANSQRPLWASTGTKNPEYSDILYVEDLIAHPCVNTMPEKTLRAFGDHGVAAGDTITEHIPAARETLARLATVGVDYDDVVAVLESEGVDKFIDSWKELVEAVTTAIKQQN
ncbi:MAG: transaldolase [Propionibacteriaceae bacterium]|nr:transaldolase [Propionibacteriaceae bacterium]